MKFKIGDPVLAIDNIGKFKDWTEGIVSEVLPTSPGYRVRFPYGGNLYVKDSNSIKPLYGDGGKKVVITTDGKTTLARLYEGNKVVKSAEAKCSPSDAFSFQTGAELAFKRLFEAAKPGPTNKYEAMSDKNLVHAVCDGRMCTISAGAHRKSDCPIYAKVSAFQDCTGYISEHPELRPALIQYCLDEDAAQEKPEPPNAPKPKPEPVKLYCVESHGTFFVRGNVYETDAKGYMRMEGMTSLCTFDSTDDFFHTHPQLKGRLVPLIKRPAKVGEWVYITASGDHRAVVGEIYEFVDAVVDGLFVKHPLGRRFSDHAANIYPSEYLVLDGYQPEEKKPEEKKPEFYNGKVVCVAKGYKNSVPVGRFVTGKIYLVQDGRVTSEDGRTSNQYISIERLSRGIGWTFIEYKGEA